MSPQEHSLVRYLATNVRESLAQNAVNRSQEFAGTLSRRIIAECAADLVETEGRRAAYVAVMRAADRLVRNRLLEEDDAPVVLALAQHEEPMPATRAAEERVEAIQAFEAVAPAPSRAYRIGQAAGSFVRSRWFAVLMGFAAGLALAK